MPDLPPMEEVEVDGFIIAKCGGRSGTTAKVENGC